MTNTRITAETVAAHIDQARKVAGFGIARLAEEAGVGEKTLRRHNNAPEKFTLGELIRIASALGEQPETFFSLDDEQRQAV